MFKNLQNEVHSSIIDESQKSLSHSKFISTTIDLLQLPISLSNVIDNEFFKIYKNELENLKLNNEQEKLLLQQRIEDLEFFSEEIKLENDDLRLKLLNYQQEKQLMETEIDNYRRQVEDFEEQFLELQCESQLITYDKSQQAPSLSSLDQSNENIAETVIQCLNYILNQIDDKEHQIPNASSLLLSSDIPTLLHSIGITNCTDEDFSLPLNFERVLHLCTLLIERCRVLQYILLKNNDIPLLDNDYSKDDVLHLQYNRYEQCKIFVHKHDHIALDTLFERIYTGMNQMMMSDDWQIVIEKPIEKVEKKNFYILTDKSFHFYPHRNLEDLI